MSYSSGGQINGPKISIYLLHCCLAGPSSILPPLSLPSQLVADSVCGPVRFTAPMMSWTPLPTGSIPGNGNVLLPLADFIFVRHCAFFGAHQYRHSYRCLPIANHLSIDQWAL